MSAIRLAFALGAATLALCVGSAQAITCPPGTHAQIVCTTRACTTICVPDLGAATVRA